MSDHGYAHAYFYGFDLTGVEPVDEILRAVASAGKIYHNTEGWTDEGYNGKPSEAEKIQAAANRAALTGKESSDE